MPAETVPSGRRIVWWGLGAASAILSALAILSLARHAFILGTLSARGEMLLSAYSAMIGMLVGWAERPLQRTLTWLGDLVGWQLFLEPYWRDMLVVVAIWIGALVWARWREFAARWSAAAHDGLLGFNHIVAFAFALVMLAIGGLLMVLITGILPVRSPELPVQLGIAVMPWFLFGLGLWLGGVVQRSEAMGVLILAGIAAFATWWLAQAVGSAIGLGIAGFAISVTVVGLMYLVLGLALVLSGKPFAQSPAVYGLYILSGFGTAAVLWVVDAGLRRMFG